MSKVRMSRRHGCQERPGNTYSKVWLVLFWDQGTLLEISWGRETIRYCFLRCIFFLYVFAQRTRATLQAKSPEWPSSICKMANLYLFEYIIFVVIMACVYMYA